MRELIVFLFLLSVFSALAGAYFSFMASTSSHEAKRKSYVAPRAKFTLIHALRHNYCGQFCPAKASSKSQANAMTFIFLSGLILGQSLIIASNFTGPAANSSVLPSAGTPAGLVVSGPSSGGQAAPGNTNSTQAAPPATVIAPQEPPPAPPSGAGNSSGAQEKSPPKNPAAPEAPPAPVNASEPAHGVAAPNDTAHTAPPAEPVKSCVPACEPCSQSAPASSCAGIQTCTNKTCSVYSQPCNVPTGTGCGKNTVTCPSGGCVGSDYHTYPANDSCNLSCDGSGRCQSCAPSCTPAISPNDTRCAGAHPAAGNSTAVNLTPNMTPPEISVPKAAPVHEPSPAVLGISLNISGNVRRGDAFSLLAEITNTGASGAKNVAVDFTLPGGVSFVSGEKSIGEIHAGETIRREFIFQPSYGAALGAGKIKVRMTYE